MKFSLNAIVVGNGTEIRYQPDLNRDRIRKAILASEKFDLGPEGNIRATLEFPNTIKHFVEKNDFPNWIKDIFSKISQANWEKLHQVVNNMNPKKSIEEFFMEAENVFSKDEERDALREVFLEYIENLSPKANVPQEEIMVYESNKAIIKRNNELFKRVSTYDLILTTNYTKLLERNGLDKGKIVYLHGEHKNEHNPPLLGTTKFGSKEKVIKKTMSNISEKSKFEQITEDLELNLDIFGWSVNNEYDLVSVIALKIIELAKRGLKFWKKQNHNAFGLNNERLNKQIDSIIEEEPNVFFEIEKIKNWKLNITYYYYNDEDKKNFLKYIKKSKFFLVDIEKRNEEVIVGKFYLGFYKKSTDSANLSFITEIAPAEEVFLDPSKSDYNSKFKRIGIDFSVLIIKSDEFWWENNLTKEKPKKQFNESFHLK